MKSRIPLSPLHPLGFVGHEPHHFVVNGKKARHLADSERGLSFEQQLQRFLKKNK